MANFLVFDPGFGLLGFNRLLGTDNNDNIDINSSQLNNAADGVWLLGGDDELSGSSANELILGNQGEDSIFGSNGQDTILGGRDNDDIMGDDGDDLLRGDRDLDFIEGGFGRDTIFGGQENDRLFGDEGDDYLSGDRGIDTLVGGDNFDTLVLNPRDASFDDINGVDVIVDFNQQEDLIGIIGGASLDPNSFTQSLIDVDGDGRNDTILRLQNGDILAVILENDNITRDFNGSDFISILG